MGLCYGQNRSKHKYLRENLGGYVGRTGPERKVVKSHTKDTVLLHDCWNKTFKLP